MPTDSNERTGFGARATNWEGWRYAGPALVVVTAALCYLNAAAGDFVSDDWLLIVNNPALQEPWRIGQVFSSSLWGFLGWPNSYYRPLAPLLWMAMSALFGIRPGPLHVVNITLHVACAGLVFLLARELVGATSHKAFEKSTRWPPIIAGLLFATHPIHTEAVAWISGVMDVGCTTFSLLALYAYVLSDGGERRPAVFVVALVALLLGLLSKEPAIVVPILMVGYDLSYRREHVRAWPQAARRWGPLVFVVAIYGVLRIAALGGVAPHRPGGHGLVWAVLNVPPLFVMAMRKLIYPMGLNFAYDLREITSFSSWSFAAAMVTTAFLLVATVWLVRVGRLFAFALLVLIAPLAPVLAAAPMADPLPRAFAERSLYFPSVGLSLLVAAVLVRLSARGRQVFRTVIAATLAVIALFAVLTIARNRDWQHGLALWTDGVRKSPQLGEAHLNLAVELMRRQRPDDAAREFQVAARLDPNLPDEAVAEGISAARSGNFMVAVLSFERALAMRPDFADAHYNLAVAFQDNGWNEQAIAHFEATLALQSDHAGAHTNLGVLLAKSGRLDDAIDHLETASRLRPQDAAAHLNLARAYELKGLRAQAEEQRRQAEATARSQ